MKIYRCRLTLLENTFFSSREVNRFFQTEALIGNYALCYALGLVAGPYYNDRTIYYREHLGELNARGVYVTPARSSGTLRFVIGQFNALSDTYAYKMEMAEFNYPQFGRIKYLGLDSEFEFFVFAGGAEPRLPRYIRLGKFMSKALVEVEEVTFKTHETPAERAVQALLNPLDLGPGEARVFNVHSIHPVPLLENAQVYGPFYELTAGEYLPFGMRFGVEGW